MPERTSTSTAPETNSHAAPAASTSPTTTTTTRRRGISENIQVFIRIRPLINRETSQERTAGTHSIRATDHQTIEVRTTDTTIKCSYDAVFDHTFTQEQVYDRVRECTQSFLQGFNSTLFAYGQTGSGKSFTMFGAESDLSRYRPGLQKSPAGIIPRAIKEIFASTVLMETDAQANVYCSFVQIYNEQIFDLLRDTNMDRPLEIHEDRQHGIFVEGLSEYAVRSVNDCIALLQCGEQHRAVRATHMNQVSSRSHSVFQLILEQRKKDGTVLKSKFNLVDLAGSEKWNMGTNMLDHHISEMTNINLSLHTLGRCIAALSSKTSSHAHIPYRDSKLTRLLQDSLGGNTKTKIIATLTPSIDCIDESISTLKFADRAKQVMVTVRVNEQREIDPAYVEKLEAELEQLREIVRLLRPNGGLSNNNGEELEENNIKTRMMRLVQENTNLKLQNENLLKEIEQVRLRPSVLPNGSTLTTSLGSTNMTGYGQIDANALQAKEQLEATLRQLKEASDRFFRFEIEEDELKKIHTRLFCSNGLPVKFANSESVGIDKGPHRISVPRPPSMMKSPHSAQSPATKPPMAMDLLYRVRGRSTSNGDKLASTNSDWRNDAQSNSKPQMDVEQELELSRKAIEKQTKLQNWLIEKEKRELLKLQQEQQFVNEQRRLIAEKDAKFYKHAAATKKKLLASYTAPTSNNKPSTAEM